MAPLPLSRLALVATSEAEELGFVALADLAAASPGEDARVIARHMVSLHALRWKLDLPRETLDADYLLDIGPLSVHVDDPETLLRIMGALHEIAERLPIVFSCHPRTAGKLKDLKAYGALSRRGDLRILEPLGYLDFLRLYSNSKLVLTDSGGLQEETTALEIPCITIRENTERPITISEGTNTLVGTDPEKIRAAAAPVLDGGEVKGSVPRLWDGKTAERMVEVFERWWAARQGAE